MTKDKVKDVCDAIVGLQSHGDDCACSSCQKDMQVIANNPTIADAVANLAKNKK